MTPREFTNILRGYRKKQEEAFKNGWIQTRELMRVIVQPYLKKGFDFKYPLPWENQTDPDPVKDIDPEKRKEFWKRVDKKK